MSYYLLFKRPPTCTHTTRLSENKLEEKSKVKYFENKILCLKSKEKKNIGMKVISNLQKK